MTIAELVVKIVFNTNDPQALPRVDTGLKSAAKGAALLTGAIEAVNAALIKMMALGSQAAVELTKYHVETGASTQTLQNWQGALRLAGVSAEETMGVFKAIKDEQAAIALGAGGDKSAWTSLGLDPQEKDPAKVLLQLRQMATFLGEAGAAKARFFAQKVGISDNFFQGLMRADLKDTGIILTTEEIANLTKFNVEWEKLLRDVDQLAYKAAVLLKPAFDKVVQGLDWLLTKGQQLTAWLQRPENEIYRKSLEDVVIAFLALGAILPVVTAAIIFFASVPLAGNIALWAGGIIAFAALLELNLKWFHLWADGFEWLTVKAFGFLDVIQKIASASGLGGLAGAINVIEGKPSDWTPARLATAGERGFTGSSSVSVTNHNTVSVDGAGDPRLVAIEVARALKAVNTLSLSSVPSFSY